MDKIKLLSFTLLLAISYAIGGSHSLEEFIFLEALGVIFELFLNQFKL